MRIRWITMTAISGMALAGCWQAGATAPEGLEDPIAQQSYGMGALIGSQLSQDITGVETAAFVKGLTDAMEGRELALDWTTLAEDEGRGLRCQVPAQSSGRPLDARLSNTAALAVSEWLEVDDEGHATVEHEGRTLNIPFVAAS